MTTKAHHPFVNLPGYDCLCPNHGQSSSCMTTKGHSQNVNKNMRTDHAPLRSRMSTCSCHHLYFPCLQLRGVWIFGHLPSVKAHWFQWFQIRSVTSTSTGLQHSAVIDGAGASSPRLGLGRCNGCLQQGLDRAAEVRQDKPVSSRIFQTKNVSTNEEI